MKVLIIEDDKDINNILADDLHEYNIETKSVYNGIDAYKIFVKELFDFIVLDIRVPDENGIELLKWIKSNYKSKVIIYTGGDEYRKIARKLGTDYFVLKGGDVHEITEIILTHL